MPGSRLGDVPLALYYLGLALRTGNARVYSPDGLQRLPGEQFDAEPVVPLDAPPHVVGLLMARQR